MSTTDVQQARARIAFISGHIDLAQCDFDQHYKPHLDQAVAAGDAFIVSSSRGADTLALDYLLAAGVSGEKITVYLNTPLPPKQPPKGSGAKGGGRKGDRAGSNQTNRRDPAPAMIQRFENMGVNVKMIGGDHTRRDTVMTRESDYDVLWVRPEEETKRLYGTKWRPGRVSGTEKNRLRREVIAVGREAMGRKGIGEVEEEREEEEGLARGEAD